MRPYHERPWGFGGRKLNSRGGVDLETSPYAKCTFFRLGGKAVRE